MCMVCGGGAVADQTCQERFVNFRAGDFSLDNAPRSGRPIEVDRDQIETLTENNQRSTTQETADMLKISKSIALLVKMKNVFYRKNHTYFLANPIYLFLYLFSPPTHTHTEHCLLHTKKALNE